MENFPDAMEELQDVMDDNYNIAAALDQEHMVSTDIKNITSGESIKLHCKCIWCELERKSGKKIGDITLSELGKLTNGHLVFECRIDPKPPKLVARFMSATSPSATATSKTPTTMVECGCNTCFLNFGWGHMVQKGDCSRITVINDPELGETCSVSDLLFNFGNHVFSAVRNTRLTNAYQMFTESIIVIFISLVCWVFIACFIYILPNVVRSLCYIISYLIRNMIRYEENYMKRRILGTVFLLIGVVMYIILVLEKRRLCSTSGSAAMANAAVGTLPKLSFEEIRDILNIARNAELHLRRKKDIKTPNFKARLGCYDFNKEEPVFVSDVRKSQSRRQLGAPSEAATDAAVRYSAAALAGTQPSANAMMPWMHPLGGAPGERPYTNAGSAWCSKAGAGAPRERFEFSKGGSYLRCRYVARKRTAKRSQDLLKDWNPPQGAKSKTSAASGRRCSLSSTKTLGRSVSTHRSNPGTPEEDRPPRSASAPETIQPWSRDCLRTTRASRGSSRKLECLLRPPPSQTEKLVTELRRRANEDSNPRGLRMFFDSIIETYVNEPARERGHPRLRKTRPSARIRITKPLSRHKRRRSPCEPCDARVRPGEVSYAGLLRDIARPVPSCPSLSQILRKGERRVSTSQREREIRIIREHPLTTTLTAAEAPAAPLIGTTSQNVRGYNKVYKKSTSKIDIGAVENQTTRLSKVTPSTRRCRSVNAMNLPVTTGIPFYNVPWQR